MSGYPDKSEKIFLLPGAAPRPASRSGPASTKQLSACECRICPIYSSSRRSRARCGISVFAPCSMAMADARQCAAGHTPQILPVTMGIFASSMFSRSFSNPRSSSTWSLPSVTAPPSSTSRVTRAWPSILVTGSMVTFVAMGVMLLLSGPARAAPIRPIHGVRPWVFYT